MKAIVVLMLILCTGCISFEEWQEQKALEETKRLDGIFLQHPEWTEEDKNRIEQRIVWEGMNKEQLLALKGKPNHVNKSYYNRQKEEQWCYSNYDYSLNCYYFAVNRLIGWQMNE